MPRKGILKEDTAMFVIYTHDYYVDVENIDDVFDVDEIDKMCKYLGNTEKSLRELISRGYKWVNKSLWKCFTDDRDPVRLI